MKKLEKHIDRELPRMVLYLDELQEIVDLLQHQPPVSLYTKTYEFNDLDELKSNNQRQLASLRISAGLSDIVIEIDRTSASIFASHDDLKSEGLVAQIGQVMSRGKRLIHPLSVNAASLVSLVLGVIFGSIGRSFIFGILVWALVFFSFAFLDSFARNKIILTYRKDETSFWQRKKDDILVRVVSTIFGIVLGVLGTLMAQSLTPILRAKFNTETSLNSTVKTNVQESVKEPPK